MIVKKNTLPSVRIFFCFITLRSAVNQADFDHVKRNVDLGFSKPTFSQKGSKRTKQTTRHSPFPLISLMPGSVVGIHIHTLAHTNTLSRPIRHVHTHARFFLPSFPSPFVHSARRGLIIPLFCLFDAERRPGGTPPSSPSLSLFLSLARSLVRLSTSGARGVICSARISRLQTAEACKTRGCARKWNLLFARYAKNMGMLHDLLANRRCVVAVIAVVVVVVA